MSLTTQGATPASFKAAEPAYILRAAEKDQQYTGQLRSIVIEACTLTFGTRVANTYDAWLTTGSDIAYGIVTTAAGMQTLGEEFCDLLPVGAWSFGAVSTTRRLLVTVLSALTPLLLRRAIERVMQSDSQPNRHHHHGTVGTQRSTDPDAVRRAKELSTEILRFHQALFFLCGAYLRLANRLLLVRMVQLTRYGRQPTSYSSLGWMILVEQAVRMVQWYRQRPATRATAAASGAGAGSRGAPTDGSSDSSDDETDSSVGTCPLCYGRRKVPSAGPCGHVFCWDCLVRWTATNSPSCCPLCREPCVPQAVVRLVGYKEPRE